MIKPCEDNLTQIFEVQSVDTSDQHVHLSKRTTGQRPERVVTSHGPLGVTKKRSGGRKTAAAEALMDLSMQNKETLEAAETLVQMKNRPSSNAQRAAGRTQSKRPATQQSRHYQQARAANHQNMGFPSAPQQNNLPQAAIGPHNPPAPQVQPAPPGYFINNKNGEELSSDPVFRQVRFLDAKGTPVHPLNVGPISPVSRAESVQSSN